jgi:hypothetical protein
MKYCLCFVVAGEINPPYKHCCATLNIFISLTVTYSSKINTEEIVAFRLPKWLSENATTLRYMCSTLPTALRLIDAAVCTIKVS